MFIQTQRLDYKDHKDEIKVLSGVLQRIQNTGTRPELKETIDALVARIDALQIAQQPVLSLYDPREDRR